MNLLRLWLIALLALLAGCGDNAATALPLAEDEATFLYFFTDG